MAVNKYAPVGEDPAQDLELPQQWNGCLKPGAGQLEYQGFETWTEAEQTRFKEGTLRAKWAVGQVSIRLPIDGFLTGLALIYGYLPFIIPIWWIIWVIVTAIEYGKPRFFPTFGLCIAASFALVNETITKKICRKLCSERISSRPPEAVCKHPGMPSGHVMNAYTLMVWTLLEVGLDQTVHKEWLLIILIIMGPVPWARVYNKDHTVAQVLASAIASVFMGSLAYYIRKTWFPHFGKEWQPWDWMHMG